MEFSSAKSKAPVVFKWMEGGLKPEIRPQWHVDTLADTGMIMVGEKRSLITGGRPDEVGLLIPDQERETIVAELPVKTIPRVEGGPQQEWIRAIKSRGPAPGSNFDYAADLTEMILLGAMAQRTGKRIEYDADRMKVTNHPDFDRFIKEPVREGWDYGRELW
jgi:hypothetical protein